LESDADVVYKECLTECENTVKKIEDEPITFFMSVSGNHQQQYSFKMNDPIFKLSKAPMKAEISKEKCTSCRVN
jgi:hypothetical protein